MIEDEIVVHLSEQGRGFPSTVPKGEIVNAILYKLKLGVHWHLLPVGALFSKKPLGWQSVAGQCVEYQGRKKRKTTNALYTRHGQGLPLAMLEPVSGNHNDLFDIEVQFEVVTSTLGDANISVEGLFMNADAGFDSKDFRSASAKKQINANICFNQQKESALARDEYFDQERYDDRYAVERTNTWMDSFCSLLNRFDTTTESWKGFSYLAFMVIALKNSPKRKMKKFNSLRCDIN